MDQFMGNDTSEFASLSSETSRGMGRRFIIKRFQSISGGNQAQGVAPTKTFVFIETAGSVRFMTGKDLLNQSGIYAIGDLQVRTKLPVFGANNKSGQQVDSAIFDGVDYQLVGLPYPVPGGGGTTEYQSVWRKA